MKDHHSQVYEIVASHFRGAPITFVEVGTFRGDLTWGLAYRFLNMSILTIDPWRHVDGVEYEASLPESIHELNKAQAYDRLAEYSGRVSILNMGSDEALAYLPKAVDMVWIDGDHNAPQVAKDLENYYPLVKSGGIFGGHDFGQAHPLTKIVMEFVLSKGHDLFVGGDYTWWVRK